MPEEQDISLLPVNTESAEQPASNYLFPVFLKLENLQVLLVGAGKVGLEKLSAVIKNSPQTKIVVVASIISDEVKTFTAAYPNIIMKNKYKFFYRCTLFTFY